MTNQTITITHLRTITTKPIPFTTTAVTVIAIITLISLMLIMLTFFIS